MNLFEKVLYFLQGEMNEPKAFGWFHIMWLLFVLVTTIFLYSRKKNYSEKQLKTLLFTYGSIALILEVLKQLIWSFNYDSVTNAVYWDYEWYAFPFQLCTTPIYVSLICIFLKKGKVRDSLLSYMAFITILGSISTIILPDSCFVSDILVNIHTMWLHLGSFVVSVFLLISGEVKLELKSVRNAIIVFLLFVCLAQIGNIVVYNLGVLNGETFNMFYISPYFISSLPVFDVIQERLPFIIFFLIYIVALSIGGFVIYFISLFIRFCYFKIKK